jgi:hypothetical protein
MLSAIRALRSDGLEEIVAALNTRNKSQAPGSARDRPYTRTWHNIGFQRG